MQIRRGDLKTVSRWGALFASWACCDSYCGVLGDGYEDVSSDDSSDSGSGSDSDSEGDDYDVDENGGVVVRAPETDVREVARE
jgi:hypothetical protein